MALIPSTAKFRQEKTLNQISDPITKTVKVDGPNPVSFYMDVTEVTVGQFKKFLSEADHPFDSKLWDKFYKYSPTDKHPTIYVTWFDATAYAE